MPFLRRRGHLASETDMRRHSLLDSFTASASASKLPQVRAEPSTESPALPSVSEDSQPPKTPTQMAPLSSSALPRDSLSAASSHAVPSIVEPSANGHSHSPDDTAQKHRRFSMLRFRNASDSQLAAKAKLHAAATEKAPPVPRRMSPFLPSGSPFLSTAWTKLTIWDYSSRNHHHCSNLHFHSSEKEAFSYEFCSTPTPFRGAAQSRPVGRVAR